jgi:DNA-binding MarR family transcriptional regulator
MTLSQFRVLSCLGQEAAGCHIYELAEMTKLTAGNIVYIIDGLEGRGLAQRHWSCADRRKTTVRLSPHGLDLLQRGYKVSESVRSKITAPLGSYLMDVTDSGISACCESLLDAGRAARLAEADMSLHALTLLDKRLGQLLRSHDMGIIDFKILFELASGAGAATVSCLARSLLLQASDVSAASMRLAQLGLVAKRADSYDKRLVNIELNSKGYERLAGVVGDVDSAMLRLAMRCSDDEREMHLKAAHIIARSQRKSFVCC